MTFFVILMNMNDQSDGDKPVLPPMQSQSGANYYRPVDEQASEPVDNSNAQVAAEAEQTGIPAEQANTSPEPTSVSPAPATTMAMSADPSAVKPQNPVDQVAKPPKLTLPSIDESPAPQAPPTPQLPQAPQTPPAPQSPHASQSPAIPESSVNSNSTYVPPTPSVPDSPANDNPAYVPPEPASAPEPASELAPKPASTPEPSTPPFSAELPAKNPTKLFGKADSPTIKPPESSAEIAEKMKTANKKTGGGALKAIMTIVLATVMVVGAWFAYNWYQSSVETTPISLNQEQNNQNNSKTSLPTNLDEDKVDVEIPDEAVALAEIPLTSYVQLGTATAETAEVSGTVCPFSGEAKPGILAFYEVDTKQLYKSDMTSENNVFTVNIPAGRYLTIFEPTQIDLPNFAYTEYVRCGLDPNECTDHSLSVYQVEAGKTYGQIRVCDPQYKQEGLPASMQFEYDAL